MVSEPAGDIDPAMLAAYEHTLKTPDWGTSTLANSMGCTVDEAEGLVHRMLELGVLRHSQESEGVLVPMAPSVGWRGVLAERERTLREETASLQALREAVSDFTEIYEARQSATVGGVVEVLHGRDAALSRVGELLDATANEVRTVVTSLPTTAALAHAKQGDQLLFSRGVLTRGLYLEAHRRQSRELDAHLRWMVDSGADVRLCGTLPSRFMIFDDRAMAVALRVDDPASGAFIVYSPGMIDLGITLFEQLWGSALTVDDDPRPSKEDFGLTDLDMVVLRLLSQGYKDAGVSRRTGMSLRTVRRTISSISERLGAQSRFELGAKCRDLDLL